MFWSRFYIPTLKENPADADVISHTLMVRAGMIRKLTAGVYTYMPYGWRAIAKVAEIVRQEMNRIDSAEMVMPTVQPAELWQQSGRWTAYGKELLRFKDRHERDCCLGPTHEEVITDLIRGEVRSYRQLPISVYQIQTKFRDEVRPRFGLMRGREFIMKDAYTFDRDDQGADKSYWDMFRAYEKIFDRLALGFKSVAADSGSIGGSFSHEFMVLADTGEDSVAACTQCAFAANIERAEVLYKGKIADGKNAGRIEEISTPGAHTVEDLCASLKVSAQDLLKTILFLVDGKKVAVLVRGDREVNIVKLKNYFNATEVEIMPAEMVEQVTGAAVGFAGPVGLEVDALLADPEARAKDAWITGANKTDAHLKNVNLHRDVPGVIIKDLREITAGDACPECGGQIELPRGIEVGHVFKLGLKYSEAMNAKFLDENGKEQFFVMGCYGIGVTRIVAASIEQNHDEKGIIFTPAIAPFEVLIINLEPESAESAATARKLHDLLESKGLDVLVDDRNERPGVKFNDADLIGIPMQLIIGSKDNRSVEAKNRKTDARVMLPLDTFEAAFDKWKADVYKMWKL
ncbi:MAG: proline--tRNA ligase [Deltaproteobacteria bacterium]|jgi:prolyl-tRNA synthetase|nr:proline--tRNA ligase [Deltaproteobacteria bacterium]